MAGTYTLAIEAGSTFTRTFTWTDSTGHPVDVTGYTGEAQALAADGTIMFTATPGAGLVFGASAGTITVTLTPAQTAAMTTRRGGRWELRLTGPDSTVTRLLEGDVTVEPDLIVP